MHSSRYLVSNRVTVLMNEAGHATEYKPVYTKEMKVYKGIDNVLQFRLKNPDQKPIDTTTVTPYFVAFDENKQQVLDLPGEVLDDGSTQTRGIFKVTIPESELLNIKQQYLTYTIYTVDNTTNSKTLTYTNEWMDAIGTLYVSGEAFPGPATTHSVTRFDETDSVWHSSIVDAQPAINGNEALHTAVIYPNNFSGVVTVQATLDEDPNIATWTDIETTTLLNETNLIPINFYGVFSYIRFKTTSNPANKISKILVRN